MQPMQLDNSMRNYPLPVPAPFTDSSLFHLYDREDTSFFVDRDSSNVLDTEMLERKGGTISRQQIDCAQLMREYYKIIPQLNKMGPDDVTKLYSSGVILTIDLLVGYFEEVYDVTGMKKDVLHIILLWNKGKSSEGDAPGWVLPGKRDQAYDTKKPDISIREASLSLVEKEIGVDRVEVVHHAVLAYFDDRVREQRFKSSGFLNFVLLNSKPQLGMGRIAVPLNGLKLLAERRIGLAPVPETGEVAKMGRNHDSLILAAIGTANFHHTMEKVKLNQARFRENQRSNPQVQRPPMSSIDPGQECEVCTELLVKAHIICTKGHTICGFCLPVIQNANKPCPFCREPLRPVPNLALDYVIQNLNPEKYRKRFAEMSRGSTPPSWENDPAFCGNTVIYPV